MTLVSKVFAYLKLMRLIICLSAFFMAIEGYWLATRGFNFSSMSPLFAAIAVGSGLAFANILNDMLDVESDKINHPHRPIPTGKVSLMEAGWLAGILLGISLLSALLAGWRMFALVVVVLVLSVVYNLWAKKVPILGNFIVASSGALIFATGYIVALNGEFPFFPLLASLLFILAREFLETVSDVPGDRIGGRRSISTLLGKDRVLQICLVLAIFSVVSLIVPSFRLQPFQRLLYLATVTITAILPGTLFIVAIWKDQESNNIHKVVYKTRLILFSSLLSFLWLV